MEIKQHISKSWTGYWRNKGNQNIPRNKEQWKRDDLKPRGSNKSSSKREIYSKTIQSQDTRKTIKYET